MAELRPEQAALVVVLAEPGSTQREVSAAYAEAIRAWPEDSLLHGSFWRMVNRAIVARWSEGALKRIKREAWRLVEM